MKIKPYPEFNEVFADEDLKGIFYPLCSVRTEEHSEKVFHFISSNGTWMDEKHESNENAFGHTLFDLKENKYHFKGNRKLYKGFEEVKKIFLELEEDFKTNGKSYLNEKVQTNDYIETQKRNLNVEPTDEFDIDYYIRTFYEFSINKLNFQLNNEFGAFRSVIDGWSNTDEISPIVYDENTDELNGTLNHLDRPKIDNIDSFRVIGKTVGHEFFTDGNDTVLFYDGSGRVLSLNSYS